MERPRKEDYFYDDLGSDRDLQKDSYIEDLERYCDELIDKIVFLSQDLVKYKCFCSEVCRTVDELRDLGEEGE